MNLRERLKSTKAKSDGFLTTPRKKENGTDIYQIIYEVVKKEILKFFVPMTAEVIKSLDKERIKKSITPVKGKDYFDGEEGDKGERGEKGDNGESVVGERGKSGVDGRDGRDGKEGKQGKDGKDGSPDTARQVVEKVNKNKGVLIESVTNLAEELIAMKKRLVRETARGGGGGMGKPVHDQFSGNGVDTVFTLTSNVAANGTAVFGVRYQGQTLYLGDQYTISGKTLTMVGFIPDEGTKIEISYIRT